MKKYTIHRKSDEAELPESIVPELARMRIRIRTEGYPDTGAVYFEGTVRTFVVERLPHETLVALLPNLLTVPAFTYRPGNETLRVERLTAGR